MSDKHDLAAAIMALAVHEDAREHFSKRPEQVYTEGLEARRREINTAELMDFLGMSRRSLNTLSLRGYPAFRKRNAGTRQVTVFHWDEVIADLELPADLERDEQLFSPKELGDWLSVRGMIFSDQALTHRRVKGLAPNFLKLPNGAIRYRVTDVLDWLENIDD